MQINYSKIIEVHGLDLIQLIKENIKEVIDNIYYLKKLKINDVEDIFERYPQIFIYSQREFKQKRKIFITSIGINYVEELENDMCMWEELL